MIVENERTHKNHRTYTHTRRRTYVYCTIIIIVYFMGLEHSSIEQESMVGHINQVYRNTQ